LNKYDVSATVSIGGSIFMEVKGWEKLFAKRKFFWNKYKSNGKKNFVLGSNFGPHRHEKFIQSYNDIFKELDDVCFRDTYSYSLFPELDNVRYEPDIIFGLKTNIQKKIKKSIGISIISLENRVDLIKYKELYIEKMVEIINYYKIHNYQITLISFCQIEGDEEMINVILDRINHANIRTLFYRGNVDSFLHDISAIEKLITCRFHSLILAYILNSKFYPIIYSKKTSDIISDYNLSNSMTLIEEIDKLTIEEIEFEFENHKDIKKSILDKSERQFWELDNFISLKSGESI
jgi:colanic acid/amylovoran biosynthesis protein